MGIYGHTFPTHKWVAHTQHFQGRHCTPSHKVHLTISYTMIFTKAEYIFLNPCIIFLDVMDQL
jgi:hypothetical protein